MRPTRITSILLLVFSQACLALDITTTNGETYRHCEITRVEPDALNVRHAIGIARIPYEELPEPLQDQYFKAENVATYRRQAEEARRAAAAKVAEEQRQRQESALRAQQQARQQADEQRRQEEERRTAELSQEQERIAAAERQIASEATLQFILIIGAFIIGVFFYFIPSIVGRHKTNARAILVLNLFLGWSFIGWVVALVWACTKDKAMDTLARERMKMPRGGGGRYIE